MKTIQDIIEYLQKAEDEGIYDVRTQNVKRHLESILKERLHQHNVNEKSEQFYCTCDKHTYEKHTCPYAEEINGVSESLCTCCSYCEDQCLMDI